MSDAAAVPSFRKGAEAAKEAAKFVRRERLQFFSLEDDESALFRFLTDGDQWIVVDQYGFVPTKPKPSDWKGDNWPSHMPAVSRRDEAFRGMYSDDYIADVIIPNAPKDKKGKPKVKDATARPWVLACRREEVKDDDGKVIGITDATREVQDGDDENKTKVVKDIIIVNQGFKNFFSKLKGFYGHYGTVVDRDYKIKREGTGTATDYHLLPMDPIAYEHEGEAVTYDIRRRDIAERYGMDWDEAEGRPTGWVAENINLAEEVGRRASDEYYQMWFIPGPAGESEDEADVGEADDGSPSSGDVTPEQLKELAQRVSNSTGGGDTTEASDASAGAPMKAL